MAWDFFLYCEQRMYYPHDGQDACLCLPWYRHGSLRSFRNSWKLLPLHSCDFLEISLPTRAHLPVHRSQSLCKSPDGIITHKSGDPPGASPSLTTGPEWLLGRKLAYHGTMQGPISSQSTGGTFCLRCSYCIVTSCCCEGPACFMHKRN